MKCPYCGKRTNDIPDHLMENKKCGKKQYEKLKIDWKRVLSKHRRKDERVVEGGEE